MSTFGASGLEKKSPILTFQINSCKPSPAWKSAVGPSRMAQLPSLFLSQGSASPPSHLAQEATYLTAGYLLRWCSMAQEGLADTGPICPWCDNLRSPKMSMLSKNWSAVLSKWALPCLSTDGIRGWQRGLVSLPTLWRWKVPEELGSLHTAQESALIDAAPKYLLQLFYSLCYFHPSKNEYAQNLKPVLWVLLLRFQSNSTDPGSA